MALSQEHHRRIRLRGGIEFNVVFVRRSATRVVVTAEDRQPIVVTRQDDGSWRAKLQGRGSSTYYYNVNPAKAFSHAARAIWRKPSAA